MWKRARARGRERKQMKVQLIATKDGNNILGSFWRVRAYGTQGGREQDLGEQIYAGYTKREAIDRARQLINNKGRLN